jgi:hypothetical protein
MRQGPNGRRPRGRHHGGGHERGHDRGHDRNGNGGNNPNRDTNRPRSAASLRHQTFDSNCIDLRVRGNAWQVHEKYQALARDAQSSGDRVSAENYLQHAEHYFRIIEAINEATALEQRQRPVGSGAPGNGGPGAPPPVPFGQQPETPANYYGTDGRPTGAPSGADPAGDNVTPMANQQAEVQPRNPPVQNPFFPPEDGDDQGGAQALVARR